MALTKLLEVIAADATQTQLATRCGVAQTTISAWIRGASLPPATRIPALAAALGMPVDDLRALVARDRKARTRNLARVEAAGGRSRRAHAQQRTTRGAL